jgi:hypothetical protein
VEGGWYAFDHEGKPMRGGVDGCRGATLPGLLFFLDCGADRDVSTDARMKASFRDQDVARVRSAGELQGIDSRVTIDTSLYIDLDSGLPIATESIHTDDYGGSVTATNSEREYAHEYVDRASLPENFFEPDGLGIEDAFPASAVDAAGLEMPLYWLGEAVPAEAGLPGLTLKEAHTVRPSSGHQALLGYRLSDHTFAEPSVTVRVYSRRAYEELLRSSGKTSLHGDCAGVAETDVDGAQSALVAEGCYADGPVLAEVQYAESVIVVHANITDVASDAPNPYASTEAVEDLAKSLTLFP